MEKKSKEVTSNQSDIHEDLDKLIARYLSFEFKRPIPDFSFEVFDKIKECIIGHKGKNIILDCGCGIGESSYHLAMENPDKLVIGIDKSLSRIARNNSFKKEVLENLFLIRGELLDLWPLFKQAKYKIEKIYLLYPNPWPKQKHLKKRFHGNPIFPILMSLSANVELRSNWKLYLDEFKYAALLIEEYLGEVEEYKPKACITPFEKKYLESEQKLYILKLKRKA